MMGSDLMSIDEAPRGAIIALGPALSSAFAGKRGALGTDEINPPKAADVFPLVRVAVSSQRRADAEVVENALEKIRRLGRGRDDLEGRGSDDLGCVGELHLDQVLRDLRRAVGVEVVVGEPIVGIREGVVSEKTGEAVVPPPWSRELEEDEEEEDVVVEVDAMDAEAASEEGRYARRGNLLKIVEGDEQACLEGFNRACDAGPLAEEPLHGVRVTVLKASGEDQEALASQGAPPDPPGDLAAGRARLGALGRGRRPLFPECAGEAPRSAEQTTRDDTGGGRHFQRALVPAGPAPRGERVGLRRGST